MCSAVRAQERAGTTGALRIRHLLRIGLCDKKPKPRRTKLLTKQSECSTARWQGYGIEGRKSYWPLV